MLCYSITAAHIWLRVSSKDWFYCFCFCSVKILIVFIGYFYISSVVCHHITDFRTSVLSKTETLFTLNFFQPQDNMVTPVFFFLLDACQHCKKQNSLLSCRKWLKTHFLSASLHSQKPESQSVIFAVFCRGEKKEREKKKSLNCLVWRAINRDNFKH